MAQPKAKPKARQAAGGSNVHPIKAQLSSGGSNPSFSGGGGGGAANDPMIDIGKLQTHVSWLSKGLAALAVACSVVLGWLVLYVYMPMRDLSQNVAVQTQTLSDVRDDVREIKDGVKDINTRAWDDARKLKEDSRTKPIE
jgi:hypothetical protein